MDAVRKAVVDLIGAAAEQANRGTLSGKLYETRNPNAYVVNESFETTRKDKVGEDYLVEGTVLVRMEAVAATLDSLGLTGNAKAAGTGGTTAAAATGTGGAGGAGAPVGTAGADKPAPTADEERIIRDYVEHMTWMVYFAERQGVDPFAMKAAVGIANEYLASNAMEVVDLAQIEKLKKDQQKAWEAETGESIGIVQWIAQKLNADVYLEIDGATAVTKSQARYSATASIMLKIYEASTARLLGSVPWTSPASAWQQTEVAAVNNVLQVSVFKAMPIAVGQAKTKFAAELKNGIKYGLVLQRTSDAKVVTAFRTRLKERVKTLRVVSQTDDETNFEVWMVGSIEDLADLVVSVAGRVPGLEGLRQVLLRGKSITFNTGM
ncbi:MAG: hypothetical protein NTU62_10830 [Spirochaetes bacterium]|nr:hypothetical protein [Spirochaetota bacterium]